MSFDFRAIGKIWFLNGCVTTPSMGDSRGRISRIQTIASRALIYCRSTRNTVSPSSKKKMRSIADVHSATVAQVALAWPLAMEAVSSIILGASKTSQLEDNLEAINRSLLPSEVDELDALTSPPDVYPNWFIERISADRPLRDALKKAKAF